MKIKTSNVWTVILAAIMFIIFSPLLYFLMGWIVGWIISITIGGIVCNGLNLIFATTRFTIDGLPLIFGIISLVSSFFHPNKVETE